MLRGSWKMICDITEGQHNYPCENMLRGDNFNLRLCKITGRQCVGHPIQLQHKPKKKGIPKKYQRRSKY